MYYNLLLQPIIIHKDFDGSRKSNVKSYSFISEIMSLTF